MNWQGDHIPEVAIIDTIRPAKAKNCKLGEINLVRDGLLIVGPKTANVVS